MEKFNKLLMKVKIFRSFDLKLETLCDNKMYRNL